jgi:hypothetical protein
MPIKRYTDRTGREVPEAEALGPGGVIRDGIRMSEIVAHGESVSMSMMLMDGASKPTAFLRDAAGAPIVLHDRATGGRMKLTADHIAAIESEAAKAGMAVPAYVETVLRYSVDS